MFDFIAFLMQFVLDLIKAWALPVGVIAVPILLVIALMPSDKWDRLMERISSPYPYDDRL